MSTVKPAWKLLLVAARSCALERRRLVKLYTRSITEGPGDPAVWRERERHDRVLAKLRAIGAPRPLTPEWSAAVHELVRRGE